MDGLLVKFRGLPWSASFLAVESLVFGFLGTTACAINSVAENTPDRQDSIGCRTIGAGPSSVVWWLVMVAPTLILLVLTHMVSGDREASRTIAAVIAVAAAATYIVLFAL